MTRRALLQACLGGVGLVALSPFTPLAAEGAAGSAPIVWRMPTEYPASTMPGEGLAAFARLAAEHSGGTLAVQPSYDAAAGLRSGAMIGAVEAGTVDAADAFTGPLAAVDPIFGLSSLPFLATSVEEARALAAIARPAYARALAVHGQRLLYVTPWAPSGIWSRHALAGAADLQGLRIRTYDATSTAILAAAGARAVNLSQADAIPQVKAGAVDAMLSSGDGGVGRRLWEQLPHFTAVQYAMPISIAVVSGAAYDALPERVRRAVDAAAAETEARQWAAIRTRLDENFSRMRQNGVVIADPPAPTITETLARAGEAAVASWVAETGPEGERILAAYRRR
ncbi:MULTISPECIES: TRAP transporter substrate-binding protein [Methylobacterium]|uniref:TRAP transporter substrate-binding protein n=1 Tax=Methylobacterium TaxID=407 RepID=UPI0013EAD29B|nr:TRAP transporter substrate-binding protein [Methylobacterium sp. DB0501]NGM35113.1 TRAP transporter substrate-binding protein [Methylobacterium sp. DB0501]